MMWLNDWVTKFIACVYIHIHIHIYIKDGNKMMSWLLMWLYKNVTIINPTLELLDTYIDILIDWFKERKMTNNELKLLLNNKN